MLYGDGQDRLTEGEAWLRSLLTWFTGNVCVNHSTHNGLRWGLASFTSDLKCMRSAYIALESLRNGYDLLVQFLGRWISQRIVYEDWGACLVWA
jgi:hypothetical protein